MIFAVLSGSMSLQIDASDRCMMILVTTRLQRHPRSVDHFVFQGDLGLTGLKKSPLLCWVSAASSGFLICPQAPGSPRWEPCWLVSSCLITWLWLTCLPSSWASPAHWRPAAPSSLGKWWESVSLFGNLLRFCEKLPCKHNKVWLCLSKGPFVHISTMAAAYLSKLCTLIQADSKVKLLSSPPKKVWKVGLNLGKTYAIHTILTV